MMAQRFEMMEYLVLYFASREEWTDYRLVEALVRLATVVKIEDLGLVTGR
jgi:hypothetical protein